MSAVLPNLIARQNFRIQPFDAPLGAEVIGLDLAQPLGDDDFAALHRAHLDHHVLVFRDQRITPTQQVEFSRRFGPLQIHVLRQFQLPSDPEVLIISNIKQDGQPIGLGDAGHYWHSDLSYKAVPSLGSMLHAQELPLDGGDTLFANQHTAWEALPPHLQRAVEGATAEHSYLFVSEHFTTRIIGLPESESRALLDELFDHSTRPEHIYRHQYLPGDMVFWDNRSVMHLAAGCPEDQRRMLYRTTIEGDVPF
jgi:taurine dioxygenase